MEHQIPKSQILIVDDSEMYCYLASLACREGGVTAIETANSIEAALRTIEANAPGACLLDARLGTRLSIPVAQRLADQGIPFAICSGDTLPDEFAPFLTHAKFLAKPSSFSDLVHTAKDLLKHRTRSAA